MNRMKWLPQIANYFFRRKGLGPGFMQGLSWDIRSNEVQSDPPHGTNSLHWNHASQIVFKLQMVFNGCLLIMLRGNKPVLSPAPQPIWATLETRNCLPLLLGILHPMTIILQTVGLLCLHCLSTGHIGWNLWKLSFKELWKTPSCPIYP